MVASGRKYTLCDLSNVEVSGHNELWRPSAAEVIFIITNRDNLVTLAILQGACRRSACAGQVPRRIFFVLDKSNIAWSTDTHGFLLYVVKPAQNHERMT